MCTVRQTFFFPLFLYKSVICHFSPQKCITFDDLSLEISICMFNTFWDRCVGYVLGEPLHVVKVYVCAMKVWVMISRAPIFGNQYITLRRGTMFRVRCGYGVYKTLNKPMHLEALSVQLVAAILHSRLQNVFQLSNLKEIEADTNGCDARILLNEIDCIFVQLPMMWRAMKCPSQGFWNISGSLAKTWRQPRWAQRIARKLLNIHSRILQETLACETCEAYTLATPK